jgi:predicted DsbA family dithiol-disulfide isomerase
MGKCGKETTMALRIEIVSDFVCPYCWLGKKRLEAALALRPDLQAELVWRPFELDPNVPDGGVPYLEFMRGIFGRGDAADARREQGWAGLAAAGREHGAEYRFHDIEVRPNTLDAHRLMRWAQDEGQGDAVAEALFAANFRDGLDIGDAETLAAIAQDAGMDAASVRARLLSGEDREAVRAEEDTFRNMGVSGVPTFILDRRLALSGAHDPQLLAQAMDRALAA